jgi:hypothetical protein
MEKHREKIGHFQVDRRLQEATQAMLAGVTPAVGGVSGDGDAGECPAKAREIMEA